MSAWHTKARRPGAGRAGLRPPPGPEQAEAQRAAVSNTGPTSWSTRRGRAFLPGF
jgi:hypothetical protein